MTLLLYGITQAILATLITRYVSQGREILATTVTMVSAYVMLSAIVEVVATDNILLYIIGVGIGTYAAMQIDKKSPR